MSVRHGRFVVGAAPVALTTTPTDKSIGSSVLVKNTSASTLYLGGSDVTTTTGYPFPAGGELSMDLDSMEFLYAIAASEGNEVAVLWGGV